MVGGAVPLHHAAFAPRGARQLWLRGAGAAEVAGEQLADAGDTGATTHMIPTVASLVFQVP